MRILAALSLWMVASSALAQNGGVARINTLPEALTSELEWVLGPLVEVANVQEALALGARGVVRYDGANLMVLRPPGESRAWPYVPSNDPQEHALAEAVARWLSGASQAPTPQAPRLVPVRIAEAPRVSWRERRVTLRGAQPWRLRVAFAAIATPRDSSGRGPIDGEDGYLIDMGGVGLRFFASRYLNAVLRVDLNLTLAWILGDDWVGTQGPEAALGGALMVVGRGRMRMGGGLGIEAILAREVETGAGHFGWFSVRFDLIGELGWLGQSGKGVVLQVIPTFTHVPYANTFHPGFIFNAGFEFGVGGN